jgi:hypothetical protein
VQQARLLNRKSNLSLNQQFLDECDFSGAVEPNWTGFEHVEAFTGSDNIKDRHYAIWCRASKMDNTRFLFLPAHRL